MKYAKLTSTPFSNSLLTTALQPLADEFLVHEIRSPSSPFVHSLAAAVRRSAHIFRFDESRNGE